MNEQILLLYLLILLVASLYSSVGHGGASGYLALMSLFSMPIATIKPVALILNIIVSLIAFIQFYRAGFFDKKLFFMLAIVSVPAAYGGGLMHIDAIYYKQLLGVFLFLSAARLIMPDDMIHQARRTPNILVLLLMGACIGFVSGLIGIGGGIILSPLIILLGYSDVKTTAGISALFIFVNSVAGLAGQAQQGFVFTSSMSIMIVLAIIGGIAGSFYGTQKFNQALMKKVLALVLLVASLKLVWV